MGGKSTPKSDMEVQVVPEVRKVERAEYTCVEKAFKGSKISLFPALRHVYSTEIAHLLLR